MELDPGLIVHDKIHYMIMIFRSCHDVQFILIYDIRTFHLFLTCGIRAIGV
jgi:hypothetical protein